MAEEQTPPRSFSAVVNHLKEKRIDAALLLLRCVTIVFTFLYVIPIAGNQMSSYQKTLISAAATNALRLHQRLGGIQFSREFVGRVFLEDSCHYLFYSILLLSAAPITMGLMPVVLFAVLHSSSFIIQLLNVGHYNATSAWRLLNNFVNSYSNNLLLLIACCEIFLMPMLIVAIFTGRGNIFMPFVYYRFLTFRYMSRRNPNTRVAFYQMRVALEQAVCRPGCPGAIRNLAHKLIAIVERLAPPIPA